jgi:hypothetical protein
MKGARRRQGTRGRSLHIGGLPNMFTKNRGILNPFLRCLVSGSIILQEWANMSRGCCLGFDETVRRDAKMVHSLCSDHTGPSLVHGRVCTVRLRRELSRCEAVAGKAKAGVPPKRRAEWLEFDGQHQMSYTLSTLQQRQGRPDQAAT